MKVYKLRYNEKHKYLEAHIRSGWVRMTEANGFNSEIIHTQLVENKDEELQLSLIPLNGNMKDIFKYPTEKAIALHNLLWEI